MSQAVTERKFLSSQSLPLRRVGQEHFITALVRITQFATWPFLFLAFHAFFRLRISGAEHFGKVKGPFIIIANHVRFYDSFLFRLALGFWTPHLPLRFMAVKKFDWPFLNFLAKIGVIDCIYSIFGVFVVNQGEGIEKGLQTARRIVANGGNVVIYPEGELVHANTVAPFKKGAAVLALMTGAPVIPVSFRVESRALVRASFKMNMGESIKVGVQDSPDHLTELFHQRVLALYQAHS